MRNTGREFGDKAKKDKQPTRTHWMRRPRLWMAGAQYQQRVLEKSLHSACLNYPTQGEETWSIYVSTPVRYYLSLLWEWGGNFPAFLPVALGHSGLWLPEKALRKRDTIFLFSILLTILIIVECDCSHEIKRHLLLGRKAMTNLDRILKTRDMTLPTKVHLVKSMVFLVVMYGCESWTIKKAEC